ncbi:MAG TPA: peptidylprolyl isomerase [Bacteroidales bacterium]|jgi:peptidyl-prolyl cis-trans isomerase SurA|nr:MAG: Chaperone SurA precursor [Bacteroidetes bacterium ADurb.Bin090]HOD25806.1 peptidylprolyl isomerase [Bacteroidales bacterium]HPN46372.1 peptidylprolyl isomerase [Bacteroidales bacterium]HQM92823.1 peptidylprolyl isomerase [Bacteroidales bacterium]
MKQFIYLIALMLAFASQSLHAQNNIVDEIVWIVGDEAILKSEVEAYRLQALQEGQKFSGDPYCVIPEQLAVQKLFLHQAELDSIIVTDNDVITNVDRNINRMITVLGSKEKMEEYFGKPISKIREEQREYARNEQTIHLMKQSLLKGLSVTPAEVRAYYKSLPSDSIAIIPAEIEVEIITVEPRIPEAEIESIKERLREFTERVNNGERFSTLAVLYSQHEATAKFGGETGFYGKGELMPEFAAVAFSLTDPTKVSRIVETDDGFHIIQLIEKRGDRVNCRHILLRPEVSATERNEAMVRLDSIADFIRKGKLSFADAAMFYSQDKNTRKNGGLMFNPNTGTAHFQLEELPQEVSKVVYSMNIGEISAPFSMRNPDNDREICAIVRVKNRTKAHKATVEEDFVKLKDIVLQNKQEKLIREWIVNKQKGIYVRIDERWRNCDFQYPGWIK